MSRIVLSSMLGFFSLFVDSIAEEVLQKQDRHETPAVAYLVTALYLAVCQFLVARKGDPGLRAKWPTMIGMGAPVLAMFLFFAAGEEGYTVLHEVVPYLLCVCAGIFIGGAMAAWGSRPARAGRTAV